ncbi:CDP-glycerol glycerophosphotransferase family protein [Marinifilum flexuosum]|uniref:CDP-glycerol glycerophosphotransferase family protein n=1 Tax=Marinifilum flexuosum TaxID=1117708 RepID=UPI0024952228|nr:CDP-glycerol glycerophosphotransferase family protein [Marinifilum flexuosum]
MSSGYTKPQQFVNFMQKIVFLHLLIFCLRNLYFIVEKLFRKNKKIALFFLTEQFYYDNSKFLFEYLRKQEAFKCLLFTANKKLYAELKQKFPNEVVYANSFTALKVFLRTKNVIISYGTSAAVFFPYYLHEKRKKIIYLGHGTPVKQIGYQTPVWNKFGKSYQLQSYSYLTACSDIECLMLASGFRVNLNQVWLTGMPRYDYLLSENNQDGELIQQHPYLDKKVILYAPTWRDGKLTEFFPFEDYKAELLERFLEEHDTYLLIRGHKESVKRKSILKDESLFKLKRVKKAEQDHFPDVTELLPFVDILITDYSSILVDYLLLDRPICFIPYDIEEYSKYQGLILDYERNTPGKKFASMQDLIEGLNDYIANPNIDQEWRQAVRETYHYYTDENHCHRIYKKILSIN